MAASDDGIYGRIIFRITRGILGIGLIGFGAAVVAKGWRFGTGFLLGACLSYLSFWRWRKVVDSLGTDSKSGRSIKAMIWRFALLAAAAYVIVKYLEVNPVAVFLGLLVSAAAVIVSIVFELIYAGT